MALDSVDLLQKLIQVPSINPMGHDIRGPNIGEERLTDFLQGQIERLGLPWLRQRVHPGRDNLVALLRGNPPVEQGGEFLLWDVHQDTVPVDGMTVDPFGGVVRDGKVYGRGASDVKGSMAAMLAAISHVASNERPSVCPTIAIALTVNEECGFTGVESLCNLFRPDEATDASVIAGTIPAAKMFPRLPDAAIVAEPTEFDVVVAHQGVIRWRCHTIGRAGHTSRPEAGINAIYGMSRVVQAIERHHLDLRGNGPSHARCGRPSVCVSTIQGGVAVNTIPERAAIEIDRRTGPDEEPQEAYNRLVQLIADTADAGECRIEHEPPFMDSRGFSDRHNQLLANALSALAQKNGRSSESVGVPYATDAAPIAAAGVPTVVFGPGSIAQAHTADEFISIAELQLGTEIFSQLATNGLRELPTLNPEP
jgi:acetylornithine deacetylase/succinyl-diaminopimelate desuccinylase-like protein